MKRNNDNINFLSVLRNLPDGVAIVKGGKVYPEIDGVVRFYSVGDGALVVATFMGLPVSDKLCDSAVFGFHIHGGNSCSGNAEDEFADVGTHYNPKECPHPYHAGDLPPIFNSDGNAFLAFFTGRFTVEEIIGKTVVLHDSPDDFTTQPSGNSGKKIACGIINTVRR